MGYLSLVNTEENWLLRAFALSRSFVIGLSFTLRVGMPCVSYYQCKQNTSSGPDQIRSGSLRSGTHLFQLGGVPHGVDYVVDCLNQDCSISGPAIGDLF